MFFLDHKAMELSDEQVIHEPLELGSTKARVRQGISSFQTKLKPRFWAHNFKSSWAWSSLEWQLEIYNNNKFLYIYKYNIII